MQFMQAASCSICHLRWTISSRHSWRATPQDEHDLQALTALGALYAHRGFVEEAREAFQQVLRVRPNDTAALRHFAALPVEPEPLPVSSIEQSSAFWNKRRAKPERAGGTAALPPRVPTAESKNLIRPGSLIANRYQIESEIGRGGMGIVFAALDQELRERVAIKSFLNCVEDQGSVLRFKQELSISRKVSHDNVIRLHDMGVHAGRLFLTMEILSGRTLKEVSAEMSYRQKLVALKQLGVGASAIHERGVVHRDLKPANIFVTQEGVIKIMDFGLAKLTASPIEGLTASGFAAGTPGYMPPEQIMSFGTVSTSADIYSVGIIAYELLGGTETVSSPRLLTNIQASVHDRPRADQGHRTRCAAGARSDRSQYAFARTG